MLLTRSPLSLFGSKLPKDFVRLACIRHAASVHPEPGSNSPFDLAQNVTNVMIFVFLVRFISFEIDVSCLVFKDRLVFISLAPRSALVYNTKHTSSCQRFFKSFSRFFQLFCYENTYKSYIYKKAAYLAAFSALSRTFPQIG